jgi:hypothetical protein
MIATLATKQKKFLTKKKKNLLECNGERWGRLVQTDFLFSRECRES